MKKRLLITAIIGILFVTSLIVFFDMTMPQLLLNSACGIILLAYLIFSFRKKNKPREAGVK